MNLREIYPTYTWANKPSAAAFTGQVIRVSDVGVSNGSHWITDGTRWVPLNGHIVLARSHVQVVAPVADANENILATITIPAGLLGVSGSLQISSAWSANNDASVKTVRARFGGIAGTAYLQQSIANVTTGLAETIVANRGAANSQAGFTRGVAGASTPFASLGSGAVDTTAETTLVLTAQKADGGDTMNLESYIVEMMA